MCVFVIADEPVPAPAPEVPDVPDAPDGGNEPGTEPLIPSEPLHQPPISPEDAALCTADLGEDVVPMTGPENDEVCMHEPPVFSDAVPTLFAKYC